MTFCNCVTSLESRDPEIGRRVPNACANVKNKQTNDVRYFIFQSFSVQNILTEQRRKQYCEITAGERANISIPFAGQRPSKSFDSCASFMTAIVAANFDCPIESCDKAPRDLNYERNTEKYRRAMKLTMSYMHIIDHIGECQVRLRIRSKVKSLQNAYKHDK